MRLRNIQDRPNIFFFFWKCFKSMFCALFLKIALSTLELMSFDHLGAAIWLLFVDYNLWGTVKDKCYADKPEAIDNCQLATKASFQMKLILILAFMKTSKIVAFGAQKTPTHTLKSRRSQSELLFGADFDTEA